ncbi:MAG: helix-turn-helix domain-containing protein [Oscillospiraceae bacterium]|nr:helix-turn-helix domain-containing protein [Oscillospiraceae bacterium]
MSFFSDRVKELRKERKMTQRQMANVLGITERSYQRYEAENNPNNETLIKLADYFDVSTDYLLGRSDNPRRQ